MKRAIVQISPELIADALHFPAGWKIESMDMRDGDNHAEVIVSGGDFPDDAGGLKACKILVHREEIRLEVVPLG